MARVIALHPNTVREHLDTLVRRGYVRRTRAAPQGRGRPAYLYERTDVDPGTSGYAGLAAALSSAIVRTTEHPNDDSAVAGAAWGRALAHARGASTTSPEDARARVIGLLDDLGYEPQSDATDAAVVRLARCPLLEAAHRYPEVVCAVHLGIVRGALEEYGASPEGTELVPFSEPGACRLVVPPVGS